jgi:hypothetical protein
MKTGKLKAILSKIPFMILPLLLGALYLSTHEIGSSAVLKEAEKIYIVDRTGERWDVTQAVSLGFNPEGFQFGLGRNAFTTLDDSLLTNDTSNISKNARVIGVTDGSTARWSDFDPRSIRLDLRLHLRSIRQGDRNFMVSLQKWATGNPGEILRKDTPGGPSRGDQMEEMGNTTSHYQSIEVSR